MIRQPTPIHVLFAWWRAAIAGRDVAMHDGLPECGFFKRKLVKGGAWVAVRIWCERQIDPETFELTAPERLLCDVDGQYKSAADEWTYLKPIPREEYDALLRMRFDVPEMMTPTTAIDLTRRPLWIP